MSELKRKAQQQIVEPIGKGAFGHVYKGIHLESGETVAIKQVPLDNIPKEQLSSTMMEIELLKRLDHPNIVRYITFIKTKEMLYIVLEYVENGSLASVIKKMGVFVESLAVRYIKQVLEGLVFLGEQGVIHRDIKGANILTSKDGVAKLADFGVATKLQAGQKSNSVVGTPYWMAPEIISMEGVSSASDIWSVGCTIIELLTGVPPYFEVEPMPAMFRIVQDDHPPIPEGLSSACQNFLMQCFVKDPNLRVDAKTLLKHPWIIRFTKPEMIKQVKPRSLRQPDWSGMGHDTDEPTTHTGTDVSAHSPMMNSSSLGDIQTIAQLTTQFQKIGTVESVDLTDEFGDPIVPSAVVVSQPPSARNSAAALNVGAARPPSGIVVQQPRASVVSKPKPVASYKDTAEDDFGDAFGDDDGNLESAFGPPSTSVQVPQKTEPVKQPPASPVNVNRHQSKRRMSKYVDKDEKDAMDGLDDAFGAGDDDLSLRLNDKMKRQWDDSVALDGFELDFGADADDALSEDELRARDIYLKQSQEIMKNIKVLQPDESVDKILQACDRLVSIFRENPAQKSHLVTHHGVLPIMEMLEVSKPQVQHAVLQVVNQIIEDNVPLQENLCLVGIIPAMLKFAGPDTSREIRIQAASFVKQMTHSSTLTLQMFIACRGLPVLVGFLEMDYTDNRHLVLTAIDGIDRVFKLKSPTPRNDFCRLFAKCRLLPGLVRVLQHAVVDKQPDAANYVNIIASTLQLFAQADSQVKGAMTQADVLKGLMNVVDQLHDNHPMLLKILKSIKNLSMDVLSLDPLQRAGAIDKLGNLLKSESSHNDIQNQVLNTLFNLCKLNRTRQEQAALAGIVPALKEIITTSPTLKQLALQILCDLAHASKPARRELARHDVVQFYIDTLKQDYWGVTALEALAAWLVDDVRKTDRVEPTLAKPVSIKKMIGLFESEQIRFFNVMNAFLKIITHSEVVNQQLGVAGFVPVLLSRLAKETDSSRRILHLKILLSLYEHHKHPKEMIAMYDLFNVMSRLREDKAVMVQDLAEKLLQAFHAAEAV